MECGDRARVTHTCSRAAEVDRPLPLRGEAACGMGRRGDGGAKAQPERSMTRLRANSFRGSRKAMSSKRPAPDLHGSSARHAAADISFEMFARRRIAAAPAADRAALVERRKAMRFRCPHAIGDGSDDNHVAPRGAPSPLIGVMRTRTRQASRASLDARQNFTLFETSLETAMMRLKFSGLCTQFSGVPAPICPQPDRLNGAGPVPSFVKS